MKAQQRLLSQCKANRDSDAKFRPTISQLSVILTCINNLQVRSMAEQSSTTLHAIWEYTTKISEEAIDVARKKAQEATFDLDKGDISFAETRLNLLNARNVVSDAIEENKLTQLPLSIQSELKALFERILANLSAMTGVIDEITLLKNHVEELTVLIWKYGFYNLSPQVLGYQRKMNDLKAMEVQLSALLSRLARIDDLAGDADRVLKKSHETESALKKALDEASSTKSQIDNLAGSTTAAQQGVTAALASVKQQSEDAARLIATITATEGQAKNTNDQLVDLHKQLQAKTGELNTAVTDAQTNLKTAQDSTAELLKDVKKQTSDIENQQKESFDTLSNELRESAATLEGNSETAIKTFDTESQDALNTTKKKAVEDLAKVGTDWTEFAKGSVKKFEGASGLLITEESEKLRTLTSDLKALELQIKDQIEKAVGFSLFNAFQKRQESIMTSKKFWQWSLFVCVAAGVGLACYFIYALHGMTKFEYAYFAKLALSLPVIYAISFCNIQYGKERRLEEEYAFKASISVSLNPYQELVGRLVNQDSAEERTKYTDFIIASIEAVFESPTDKVYGSETKPAADATSLEKISKQLAPVLEPLAKIFVHK